MQVENEWFYFGKVPYDLLDEIEYPEGWEPTWFYRIRIDTENEELKIEDTCGRMVPLEFSNLLEFQETLAKVQGELLSCLIGAPNPNVGIFRNINAN